jgi:broad specificity phosphatase PhoE
MHFVSVQFSLSALIILEVYSRDLAVALISTSPLSTETAAFHSYNNKYNPSRRLATSPSPKVTTTMTFWSSWMSSWWGAPQIPDDTQQQNKNPTTNQKYTKGRKNLIKKVTFVRHGCTYMNEYLAGKDGGKRFASHDFTDIFDTAEQQQKYHDTPLSPFGREQAKTLGSYPVPPTFTQNCDLVVVSPLTRALQTFELGIKPYIPISDSSNPEAFRTTTESMAIPIIALPYAAERLYLISDVGRPIREMQKEFPYVDFQSELESRMSTNDVTEAWWYQPPNDGSYEEWRPMGQQQKYACPAEPYDVFNVRMSHLYYWLQNRSEMNIIVVCHHGVIDWMLDMSFANCQYKQLPFTSIKPRTLIRIDEMEPMQTARL